MTDAPNRPEDADDMTAAEYVIGLQDQADRAATAARIGNDPAFADLVQAWEVRLHPLSDDYGEVAAPPLLPAIEARLFPKAARGARARGRAGGRAGGRVGGRWQWFAGAGVAAVLFLVAMATLAPPGSGPGLPKSDLVATLASEDGRLAFEVRQSGDELAITRVAGPPAVAGRVHEVWLIAPDAAPVSLGTVADAPISVAYPRPPEGWQIAVSIEPEGGSPYGTPTGPVILTTVIGGAS